MPLPEDAQCRECRYPLRGLTTPRCPECGTTFDPKDDETYHDPVKGPLEWQPAAALACLLVYAMVAPASLGSHSTLDRLLLSGIVNTSLLILSFVAATRGILTLRGWNFWLCMVAFGIALSFVLLTLFALPRTVLW